jgi:hypothetical protein
MPNKRQIVAIAGAALLAAAGALSGPGAGGSLALSGMVLQPGVGTAFAQEAGGTQLPLAPRRASGQTVTPVYEGWYENADGSYSLSFGYYNRNSEEVVEISVGSDNSIEPEGPDRGQPTRFEPGRHWGVFAVQVPAGFGGGRVVWTLKVRGETFSIPGHLRDEWKIDALAGEAGAGNTPPVLRVAAGGPEGAGPAGITAGPLAATVGTPLTLTVWARDDGRPSTSVASGGRTDVPVTLTWFKHRGPGEVAFSEETAQVPVEGGEASTQATFSAPGDYVVRVRANDASGVSGAGHAQCCWSNGFIQVRVAPPTGGDEAAGIAAPPGAPIPFQQAVPNRQSRGHGGPSSDHGPPPEQ